MKSDIIRYLIVGCERSGTTAVDQAVTGHPEVSAVHDEIRADPLFVKGLSIFTCGHERPEEHTKGWRALFDAIAGINCDEKTRVIGMKCAISRLHKVKSIVENAKKIDANLRIIFVNRGDLAAQYGSLLRARQTGIWHSWNQGKSVSAQKINPDLSIFSQYASECLEIAKEFRSLKTCLPFKEVSYENDIEPNLLGCARDVFEFLGLSPCEPHWLNSKKVSPPPESFINNYAGMVAEVERLRQGGRSRPRSARARMQHVRHCLAVIRQTLRKPIPAKDF